MASQPRTCALLPDLFYDLVQTAIILVCAATLIFKKVREVPGRTWIEFLLDSSKQIAGMAWVHLLSLLFATWHIASLLETDCASYWASTVVDTTVGAFVNYLLLNTSSFVLEKITGDTRSFLVGDYRDEQEQILPRVYFKQLAVWLACVTCTKLIIATLTCYSAFTAVANFFLACVSWSSSLELVFVRLFTPACMTALQCWLTDNFIRKGGVPFKVCWQMTKRNMRIFATAPPARLAKLFSETARRRQGKASTSADGPREALLDSTLNESRGRPFTRADLERAMLPDPHVAQLERQVAIERKERERLLALERRYAEQRAVEERRNIEHRWSEEHHAAEEARRNEIWQLRELASEDAAERQGLRTQVADLQQQLTSRTEALQAQSTQVSEQMGRSTDTEVRLRAQVARLTAAAAAAARAAAVPSAGIAGTHRDGLGRSVDGGEDCPALAMLPNSSNDELALLTRGDLARLTPGQTLIASAQRGAVLDRKLGQLEAKIQDIGGGACPGDHGATRAHLLPHHPTSERPQPHRQGINEGQAMWNAFQPLLDSAATDRSNVKP